MNSAPSYDDAIKFLIASGNSSFWSAASWLGEQRDFLWEEPELSSRPGPATHILPAYLGGLEAQLIGVDDRCQIFSIKDPENGGFETIRVRTGVAKLIDKKPTPWQELHAWFVKQVYSDLGMLPSFCDCTDKRKLSGGHLVGCYAMLRRELNFRLRLLRSANSAQPWLVDRKVIALMASALYSDRAGFKTSWHDSV